MRAVPPALFALCLASIAGAQEAGPDPEVARIRANRTVDCLERVGRDLTTTMDLLRDASRQTQSIDQAGFRPGFSCNDHLFVMTLLTEIFAEYQRPLWAVAVDFRKAFDSISHIMCYGMRAEGMCCACCW